MLYQENQSNKLKEIDKKISHAMNDYEKLQQCETWLVSI